MGFWIKGEESFSEQSEPHIRLLYDPKKVRRGHEVSIEFEKPANKRAMPFQVTKH